MTHVLFEEDIASRWCQVLLSKPFDSKRWGIILI